MELIVVLCIISLLSTLSFSMMIRSTSSDDFEDFGQSFYDMLLAAKNTAMLTGKIVIIKYNPNEKMFYCADNDSSLELKFDLKNNNKDNSPPTLRFFPDGRAEGAILKFTNSDDSVATFKISPLTGDVIYEK